MQPMLMMKRTRTRLTPSARAKKANLSAAGMPDLSQGESPRGNAGGNSRGNIHNLYEKYTTLAREALTTGDRVLAESYYQQAEHYLRVLNETKEAFPILPKSEKLTPAQNATMVDSTFEASIEEELTLAQTGRL